MMQEAKLSCRGRWYLPAGRMERNESIEVCVCVCVCVYICNMLFLIRLSTTKYPVHSIDIILMYGQHLFLLTYFDTPYSKCPSKSILQPRMLLKEKLQRRQVWNSSPDQ